MGFSPRNHHPNFPDNAPKKRAANGGDPRHGQGQGAPGVKWQDTGTTPGMRPRQNLGNASGYTQRPSCSQGIPELLFFMLYTQQKPPISSVPFPVAAWLLPTPPKKAAEPRSGAASVPCSRLTFPRSTGTACKCQINR